MKINNSSRKVVFIMADMDGIKKNEHEGIDPLKNFHTDAAPGKTN